MNVTSQRERMVSPEFARFAEILLELQRKRGEGSDGDDDSETLRDESEALWWKLTEEQRRAANGLSEDLLSLTDPVLPGDPANPQFDDAMRRARRAFEAGHFFVMLDVLRRWRSRFRPAKLASLRAMAWQQIGFPAVAFAFADFGVKFDRNEYSAGYARLHALAQLDSYAPRREFKEAEASGKSLSPGEVWWIALDAVRRNVADNHELAMVKESALELLHSTTLSHLKKLRAFRLALGLGNLIFQCMHRGADWAGWCSEITQQVPDLANTPILPEDFQQNNQSKLFEPNFAAA